MPTLLTNADFDKMIVKSYEEAFFYSKSTSDLLFALDELTSGELSGEENQKEVEGKNGNVIAILKNKKSLKFTCENAYVTTSGLATQMGTTIGETSGTNKAVVERQEYLTLSATKTLTLTDIPSNTTSGGSGTQTVKKIYLLNSDGSKKGTAITPASVADKVVTLTAGTEGDKYLVIYDTEVSIGKTIVNDADNYTETVKAVINVLAEDACHNEFLIQVVIPSFDIKGSFSLSAGDKTATMKIEGTAIKDICTGNGQLCTFVIA